MDFIPSICNSQDADEAAKWKDLLIASINRVLSHLHKVPYLEYHDQMHTSLDFISTVCNKYPNIFVPSPSCSTDHHSSHEFNYTKWIMKHLLNMVTVLPTSLTMKKHPREHTLSKNDELKWKIASVIVTLLCATKNINILLFSALLKEFVACLKDLSRYLEQCMTSTGSFQTLQLKRFKLIRSTNRNADDDRIFNKDTMILVDNSDSCQELQTFICQVLNEMMVHCLSFGEQVRDVLCSSILKQLQYGDCELKYVSLQLGRKMMELMCPGTVLPFKLCPMILATINFVSLGNTCYDDSQYDRCLWMKLEEELGKSLMCLLDYRYLNVMDKLVMRRELKENLASQLIKTGSGNFKSNKLKCALISCFAASCRIVSQSSSHKNALDVQMTFDVCKVLVNEMASNAMRMDVGPGAEDCGMGEEDSYLKVCCRFMLQVIHLEIDRYCSGVNDVKCDENKPQVTTSILEMNLFQCEVASPSRVSSLLLETALKLLTCIQEDVIIEMYERALRCTNVLKFICDVLCVSCGVGKKYASNERPQIYDECLRMLNILFQFLSAVAKNINNNNNNNYNNNNYNNNNNNNNKNKDIAMKLFNLLVHIINSMSYIADLNEVEDDLNFCLIGLVSLPWLSSEISTLDLKLKEHRIFFSISESFVDLIDMAALKTCIEIISSLSKPHLAHQWRSHVLRRAWDDTRPGMKRIVIECLVHSIHRLSTFSWSFQEEIVRFVLDCEDDSLKLSLAGVMKPLLCSLAGRTTYHRRVYSRKSQNVDDDDDDDDDEGDDGNKYFSTYGSHHLHCSICHGRLPSRNDSYLATPPSINISPPASHIITVLKGLKSLLQSNSTAVKIELIEQMEYLFRHIHLWLSTDHNAPTSISNLTSPASRTTITINSNSKLLQELLESALYFMLDDQFDVRMAFSDAIRYLKTTSPKESKELVDGMMIQWMNEKIDLPNKPSSHVHTLLLTVSTIARYSDRDLLLPCVSNLLSIYLFPKEPFLEELAHTHLLELSADLNISMLQLFRKFYKEICKGVVQCMHATKCTKRAWNVVEFLNKVATVFSFDSPQIFIKSYQDYLLPYIAFKADETASEIIKEMAGVLQETPASLIVGTISHVFSHLVICTSSLNDHTRVFTFLESQSGMKLDDLLKYATYVDSYLLVHLSDCYDQVIKGLKIYLRVKGVFNDSSGITASNCTLRQLADKLQPLFLGVLVHYDKNINDASSSISDKMRIYKSLILLMELMGSQYCTRVRLRIMKTLKIGLQFKEEKLVRLCCDAWACFVRIVDISSLGPILSQIAISLQSVLPLATNEVTKVLNYLIVENREKLHDYLCDLFFIPNRPELKQVHEVARLYQEGEFSCKDVAKLLERLLRGVGHDSLEVRQTALRKLKELIRANKKIIQNLMVAKESADPIIGQMIDVFLQACRDPDANVRNLVGQCLGEMGAIDPGRLEMYSTVDKKGSDQRALSLDSENYGVQLIVEMTKAFLRVDDSVQDCVAYAIQELLRLYNFGASSEKWSEFSDDVIEILTPLTQSRYKVINTSVSWTDMKRPVYGSARGRTFDRWITTLTGYLGSTLKKEKCRNICNACCGVIKSDVQISMFLLPDIVVQVVLDNDKEHVDALLQEILTILEDCNNQRVSNTTQQQQPQQQQPQQQQQQHISISDIKHMCAQTTFTLLDHLNKWLRYNKTLHSVSLDASNPTSRAVKSITEHNISLLGSFLSRVPQHILSITSFNCGAYTRSLFHHEQHIKSSSSSSSSLPSSSSSSSSSLVDDQSMDFLLKLYIALDEPDGVAGLMSMQDSHPSLTQQILAYESVGQLSDASTCYDRAIQMEPDNMKLRMGHLRNKIQHGELNSVLSLTNGMIGEDSSRLKELNRFRVEASWKLGHWDLLEQYLDTEDKTSTDWNVGLGKLLMAVKSKDAQSFHHSMTPLRLNLIIPLSAASMEVGSYSRGYESVVRLHMLNELEEAAAYIFKSDKRKAKREDVIVLDEDDEGDSYYRKHSNEPHQQLVQTWTARLEICQPSYRTVSPILDLRRAMLSLMRDKIDKKSSKTEVTSLPASSSLSSSLHNFNDDINHWWLVSAKMAREYGLMQTAHSCLLSAGNHHKADFCMEMASWLWDRGDVDEARSSLEKAYKRLSSDKQLKNVPGEERNQLGKLLLQLTRYSDETSSLEVHNLLQMFKEAKELNQKSEEIFFYMGKFYDKLQTNIIEGDNKKDVEDKRCNIIAAATSSFMQSLTFGNHFIYQSLPRLLTLWLDFTAEAGNSEENIDKINKAVNTARSRLSSFQLLVALPQLISRICHTRIDVFNLLKDIVVKVLRDYPQQAMWLMVAVSKSSYQVRSKKCQEIFNKARSVKPELTKFLHDSTKFADFLIELCNKDLKETSTTTVNISHIFKPLFRFLSDKDLSQILMPLESQMTPVLPNVQIPESADQVQCTRNAVYIAGIEDNVDVLVSLQKPKKVTFRGSDGKKYVMLCKPKDDLRKDARLMEFTGIVNRCLKKNFNSRRRNLHIRTFTVTPLDEDCGMLEWVPNTTGLRPILLKLYKEKGLYMSGKELKLLQTAPKEIIEKKLVIFKEKLLTRHPPVFSEWFVKTFTDPASWYSARLSYCRTTAVMSMVGYILGLGDRHGENILFDSTCGDCVHVDFSCLFNKGEQFDYPELVPFRLTHNMIDAMGALGYEGIFRKSCEVTMRVMREEMDSLMSVLKTFIFDPLVEWKKPAGGRNNPKETGEIRNEQAQTHVNNIENRLRGSLKSKMIGFPLSVEGQVSSLIKEATDEKNLCQMYFGWAAYM